jgi:hypothetical protein
MLRNFVSRLIYITTMENTNEKKSTGTANSSGSPLSKDSGFEKAIEKDPSISTEENGRTTNPFAAAIPDASTTPTGAPEAAGTGTGSPHISENPDKQ